MLTTREGDRVLKDQVDLFVDSLELAQISNAENRVVDLVELTVLCVRGEQVAIVGPDE